MKMKKVIFSACLTLLMAAGTANASVSVTGDSFSYTQSFDSLTGTGWTNDSTLSGWFLFNKAESAITSIAVNNGSSNYGSFYNYGTTGNTDRALGGLGSGGPYFGSPASGTVAGWIAVSFQNNTNTTLNSLKIEFDGEQWRNGGNTSSQTMTLQYGSGSTFGAVTNWITPGGNFSFTSPIASSTASALDGNDIANRVTGLGGSLTNLAWAANETLWIRWVENNDIGNDHGLAIDNVSFSAGTTPTPVPAAAWLLGSGLLGLVGIRRRKV